MSIESCQRKRTFMQIHVVYGSTAAALVNATVESTGHVIRRRVPRCRMPSTAEQRADADDLTPTQKDAGDSFADHASDLIVDGAKRLCQLVNRN